MSNIIAGFFNQENDYKKVESDLEGAGFLSSDYVVFLHDDVERYLVSVQVSDDVAIENTEAIFKNNHATNCYFFEGLTKPSFEELKTLIEQRAKAEIANSPDVDIKTTSDGMDSQVTTFGE